MLGFGAGFRKIWAFRALALVLALTIGSVISLAGKQEYQRVINLAGMQRMLTQKMSKESVLVALGIDREQNLKSLEETRTLFALTLRGLRQGDAALGLPETTEPEILEDLSKVEALWPTFEKTIRSSVKGGQVSEDQLATIALLNEPLLQAMDQAVQSYEDAATRGELRSVLAVAVNVSGRQRMLTQKMTKEFLLIAYDHEAKKNRDSLKQTYRLFDKTLNGLLNGDPELRLLPAPTPELKVQLRKVQRLWDEFLPALKSVMKGGQPTDKTIAFVVLNNLPLLKEMNKAVLMYERL
jgi:hypothetical protein